MNLLRVQFEKWFLPHAIDLYLWLDFWLRRRVIWLNGGDGDVGTAWWPHEADFTLLRLRSDLRFGRARWYSSETIARIEDYMSHPCAETLYLARAAIQHDREGGRV